MNLLKQWRVTYGKLVKDPCNHLPCTHCTLLKGPGTKASVGPVMTTGERKTGDGDVILKTWQVCISPTRKIKKSGDFLTDPV